MLLKILKYTQFVISLKFGMHVAGDNQLDFKITGSNMRITGIIATSGVLCYSNAYIFFYYINTR